MFRISSCASMAALTALTLALAPAGSAQSSAAKPAGPTDEKAKKTFATALEWEKQRNETGAIDAFRKANRQDGGHCFECMSRAYTAATSIGDYKDAEEIGREWLPQAATDADRAAIHYHIGVALMREGIDGKKDKCFSQSCDELRAAVQLVPTFPAAHYALGVSLAHLYQDDAARSEFSLFLSQDTHNPDMRERVARFLDRIELARARMAPPFSLTTLDGNHISMDSLAGKVVLIDFWATWCGPCREALPHIREIAKKFDGQPLVVLSISLDSDEAKWKNFVSQNGMTWLQYRDGSFNGKIAKTFGVNAIPATFTIDADGVLEDQHVGDASIEGKLRKLIAHASERNSARPSTQTLEGSATGVE
jgi:thiol-disulfide isomerase/thioredoxin